MGGIGSSAKQGYVEGLGNNGEWGGICGNGFNITDANVICNMLGFPSAIAAVTFPSAGFLYGNAPSGTNFVLDNLGCMGNESSVFDCPHSGQFNVNCKASKISGVQCATSKL